MNINTSTNKSPTKSSKPLKKVDLGAAANFGKEESKISTQNADLLNDDFNPRAQDTNEPASPEFGNFEAAFGSTAASKPADDFADFSSAFSPAQPSATQVPQSVSFAQPQQNLMQPPATNSAQPPMNFVQPQPNLFSPVQNQAFSAPQAFMPNSGATSQKSSGDDLLGDLSGFSSLNIQQGDLGTTPNNNQNSLLGSNNIMDGFGTGWF